MSSDLFKQLNQQQHEAVGYIRGPCIVLAGAGSGKTRVLVYKVLHLIGSNHALPSQIVMITFTNKAANEMRKRMGNILLGYIGTFHSFCAQILRREGHHLGIDNNFIIYDEDDQLTLIKSLIKKLDVKKFTPNYFLNRISAAKNNLVEPEKYLEFSDDLSASLVAEIYENYQKTLRKNKALDFDDLILETVKLFQKKPVILEKYQNRYRFLLVDEFQDINYAQYVLTKILGQKYQNVTIVGDFSQSIYSWRGADIRNLEKFREDFPQVKVFSLEENYRSTQKILDFAYRVISKNQTHPVLNLYTNRGNGEGVEFYQADNEEEEAIFVANTIRNSNLPYHSFAVLYRINAQSRVIEEAFLHYGLPYVLIGGVRFYERKEIKDILSFLRLLHNPLDSVSKERIKRLGSRRWRSFNNFYLQEKENIRRLSAVELIERVLAATSYFELYDPNDEEDFSRLENIKELKSVAINFPNLTAFLEQVALVESEYFQGEKVTSKSKIALKQEEDDRVKLMTLHQAKGLEFRTVFIVGVEEGILPHSRSLDDLNKLEEERRLFYVGITRAKEKLFISYSNRRTIFGKSNYTTKSRFLEEED